MKFSLIFIYIESYRKATERTPEIKESLLLLCPHIIEASNSENFLVRSSAYYNMIEHTKFLFDSDVNLALIVNTIIERIKKGIEVTLPKNKNKIYNKKLYIKK